MAYHGMQGVAESTSTVTAITKRDNIAVQIVDKKWLKDVFAPMNCFGTQGAAVKWLWDMVTMMTNHAMMRGMVNLLHMRIRGSIENRRAGI